MIRPLRHIGLALCLLLALAAPAAAQTVKTYAVLPFKVNGPEKFLYLGPAVQSMLTSRLTLPGKFEPVSRDQVAALGAALPASTAQGHALLSRVNGEYLYYGTINILGNRASVEIQRLDIRGQAKTLTQEMAVEDMVPVLDTIAKQQLSELFGVAAPAGPGSQQAEKSGVAVPSNPAFLTAEGAVPTNDPISAVNPQFRYEGGAETPGQWRTQNLSFPSRGMVIGDAAGDRKNVVFVLGEHSLNAYSMREGRLVPLDEVKFSTKYELLYIGMVDVDGDGVQDIVVSSFRDDEPYSMIFTFKGHKLQKTVDGIKLFLSVINTPPAFSPTLVGQKKGMNYLFDSREVTECALSGSQVIQGKRLNLPEFANVYNFAFLPDKDGYKIVLADDYNHLKVYTQNVDLQSSTEDTYNSSAIDLEFVNSLPGLGTSAYDRQMASAYFIPIPMRITTFATKGKYELLVNKDISVAAQIFSRFRTFTQGELHALFWDGVGLNLAWKTRRIKGTVVGYQIADPNNDGKMDLCVLVNTYPGAVGLEYRKTVIMGYELNLDQMQK